MDGSVTLQFFFTGACARIIENASRSARGERAASELGCGGGASCAQASPENQAGSVGQRLLDLAASRLFEAERVVRP